MKELLLKTAGLAAALVMACGSAATAQTEFSYSTPGNEVTSMMPFGFNNVPTTVEAAILVKNDELVNSNAKVVGMRVPVYGDAGIKNYRVWLSRALPASMAEGEVTVPDIVSVEATPKDGMLEVFFPEPVDVTANGVFLGYTFDVTTWGSGNANARSLAVTIEDMPTPSNAFWLRADKLTYNWNDYSIRANNQYVLNLTALIQGDFTENSVDLLSLPDAFTVTGHKAQTIATVVNMGFDPVSTVEFTGKVGDKEFSGSYTFDPVIRGVPGTSAELPISLEATDELGTEPLELTITKVNGEKNVSFKPTQKAHRSVASHKPVHRSVVEEVTGTWCPNCPRGFVGMEKLREKFPEFVGYAFHQGEDPMVIAQYPYKSPKSFPGCYIDRKYPDGDSERYVDPFYGTGDYTKPLQILNDYADACNVFSLADFGVKAEWTSDDQTEVKITSTSHFAVVPYDGANYRLQYLLVADGLMGAGAQWAQKNGFAGSTAYSGQAAELLKEYIDGSDPIYGQEYNEVVVYSTGEYGITGSLPAQIERDTDYTHSYTVKIDDCVSVKGVNLVQDKEQLRAVALLVRENNYDTEIVNAAMVKVGEELKYVINDPGDPDDPTVDPDDPTVDPDDPEAGIAGVNADVKESCFYTLTGAKVANPVPGSLYIRVDRRADGFVRASKVIK